MDKEFFVISRQTCPECKGDKFIKDPTGLWAAHQKEFVEPWRKSHPNEVGWTDEMVEASDAWWKEQGYGPDGAEEEWECYRCDDGILVEEIPLAEAMLEVERNRRAQQQENDFSYRQKFFCTVCHSQPVDAHNGFDTCPSCTGKI